MSMDPYYGENIGLKDIAILENIGVNSSYK